MAETNNDHIYCGPWLNGPPPCPSYIPSDAAIEYIEEDYKDALLQKYALCYPPLAHELAWYQAEHRRKELEEEILRANTVLNFDSDSREIWYILNGKHKRLSARKQFEITGEVESEIENIIQSIEDGVDECGNFLTRRNAALALRKIGKTFCLSTGELGRAMRNGAEAPNKVTDLLRYILEETMTKEERSVLRSHNEKGEGIFDAKLEELVKLGKSYGIMDGLGECLELLRNENSTEDDGEVGQEDENDVDGEGGQEEGGDRVEDDNKTKAESESSYLVRANNNAANGPLTDTMKRPLEILDLTDDAQPAKLLKVH